MRYGQARIGMERHGRIGVVRRCLVRLGMVGFGPVRQVR